MKNHAVGGLTGEGDLVCDDHHGEAAAGEVLPIG
jgi:hypothetical protein